MQPTETPSNLTVTQPSEIAPLFKADSVKDRKISVSYQGWDARSLSRRTSVKHNSEAAHEIEASARSAVVQGDSAPRCIRESVASGKRPSEAAARPIFVTANFVTRLLFVTAPNASR